MERLCINDAVQRVSRARIPIGPMNQIDCRRIATMAMPRIEAMASDWLANRETVRFFSRSRREKDGTLHAGIAMKNHAVFKRRINND